MSLEPIQNLENPFPDIASTVRDLVEKSLKQMKNENDKLEPENQKNSPEVITDPEFRRNIVKRIRQHLEEKEKPLHLKMQNEVEEIRDKFSAFQKRTDNIIEDLKFIKMLMLEANDRLDDLQTTDEQEPQSSFHPE